MFLLTIYLPWLLNMLPYSYWALTCLAVLPTYSAFMISVRQASDLPPASFRFPVTQDTLALGYILPAVGRIGDFHPLKHAPAGRTKKRSISPIWDIDLFSFDIDYDIEQLLYSIIPSDRKNFNHFVAVCRYLPQMPDHSIRGYWNPLTRFSSNTGLLMR